MSNSASSIIGPDLTIEGTVVSGGALQIDGEIRGDVRCVSLVLGEKALVTGGVVAEDVVVEGRVDGSISGHTITLRASSHVEGDIQHQCLTIEQGAFFEGMSRRVDDPVAIGTASRLRQEDKAADRLGADLKKSAANSTSPRSRIS